MTFNTDPNHPSNWSRDERNLYGRVFAGFLWAGPPERQALLFGCDNLLAGHVDSAWRDALPPRVPSVGAPTSVSLDNNLPDFVQGCDQGPEFGDVVIWGPESFLTVEAKGFTDWSPDKDVWAELENAARVADHCGLEHAAHLLILAERKWERVRSPSAANQPRSRWKALVGELERRWERGERPPLVVLTWEQIADEALSLGAEGESFGAWLKLQVDMCLRPSSEMPPTS